MTAFDADALERRYAFLDACPEALVGDVVTLPIGTLPERVGGVLAWRKALLAGTLPPEGTWPGAPIDTASRRALADMDLARFCADQPDLTDALLENVLASFRRQEDLTRSEVAERLRELEELERVRRDEEASAWTRGRRPTEEVELDEATLRRLREQAEREVAARPRSADPALVGTWAERVRAWSEIGEVFGDLGEMMGRGWDLARGVLRHAGWLDLVALRKLLEQLPQLREIVRQLGRLQVTEDAECVADTLLVPVRRLEEERREVRTPLVPAETRGIERSGEIARMLPAEAAMLGHPKLRLLWHARRAERALLTYRVEGVEIERRLVEREVHEEREARRPRPDRGPILAVVDTSGSMHGLPETVAKALVLETLRTAHAEGRRCLLYAYSGPGQVREHALDLTREGIGRLLAFLGLTFGGGNDETGMMARVV
ncbi:MAG: VWA domain-containing protein, partial [Myxococcota bacterium]